MKAGYLLKNGFSIWALKTNLGIAILFVHQKNKLASFVFLISGVFQTGCEKTICIYYKMRSKYPPSFSIHGLNRGKSVVLNVTSNYFQSFKETLERDDKILPHYVTNEFHNFLNCGDPEKGFLRLHCSRCNQNKFVTFSCKSRGICPSCCSRKMSQSAMNLVEYILPHEKIRQWVISFPFHLRYLFS